MNRITDIITENMMNYSAYVITDRVIPSVEDGLKPVHRRIIWTMLEKNALKFTKSANIVGATMEYHPHGSTYSTIVNMVQTDSQNIPLIVGKGNFAQHTSREMSPAADRYTEVRLSDMSLSMLEGVKKQMVEFIPNYDNTKKIPKYLPTKFPSILCYATTGIGVGMSTSIPSYNINEVCDATIEYLATNKKTILLPDFATGGSIVEDKEALANIINRGKGTIRLRAKCEVEKNTIKITEIPYSTTREDIINKIIELVKDKKINEISDIKDLTGKKGLLIEITCKRGSNADLVLQKLYKISPLESTFSANMNVLHNGKPYLLGFYEIIDRWYEFRKICVKNSLKHNIDKLEAELHLLRGLRNVLLDIDKAIDIIRNSKNPELEISKYFNVDSVQSEYICNIKLKNINKNHIISQLKNIKEKEELLSTSKLNMEDETFIKRFIIEGIKEVKEKFATKRRTEIIKLLPEKKVDKMEETMTNNYDVVVILTKEGYFKKLKTNSRSDNKIKQGDKILYTFNAKNNDEVVFFGEDLNCYKFKLRDLEENKLNTLGVYIPNIINTKCLGMTIIDNKNKYVIMVYKDRIAKIKTDSYKTSANRRMLKNSLYSKDLVYIHTLTKDETLKLCTKKGKIKEVDTRSLTVKSARDSQGIKMLGKDEFTI